MELGYIGLGKMGSAMVERLMEKGHRVVVHDRDRKTIDLLAAKGAAPAGSIDELASSLGKPRLVWIMVPHQAVDGVFQELSAHLAQGDTIIDGGNSPYRDSIRRAEDLAAKGIDFLDAGVSGGPSGARHGACIMVGGRREVYLRYEGFFRDLAVEGGWAHVGRSGAGHFVKMVHNGIEYGMMQALAEGFSVMKQAPFDLDLAKIADLYDHRSVIESRLVGWLKNAFVRYGDGLEGISGSAAQSGEGLWTVEAAKELGVPVPVIEAALKFRTASQKDPRYPGRIISALRNQFGGHEAGEQKR